MTQITKQMIFDMLHCSNLPKSLRRVLAENKKESLVELPSLTFANLLSSVPGFGSTAANDLSDLCFNSLIKIHNECENNAAAGNSGEVVFVSQTGRCRLLKTYENSNYATLDDVLHACAVTIEDALITGGARPGVDYTRIDLYRLAMKLPHIRATTAAITVAVPDEHPHAGLYQSSTGAAT